MENKEFKIFPDSEKWIKEVSDNFEVGKNYLTIFIQEYMEGSLLKNDLLKVVNKVAKEKQDLNLIERVKSMLDKTLK